MRQVDAKKSLIGMHFVVDTVHLFVELNKFRNAQTAPKGCWFGLKTRTVQYIVSTVAKMKYSLNSKKMYNVKKFCLTQPILQHVL